MFQIFDFLDLTQSIYMQYSKKKYVGESYPVIISKASEIVTYFKYTGTWDIFNLAMAFR